MFLNWYLRAQVHEQVSKITKRVHTHISTELFEVWFLGKPHYILNVLDGIINILYMQLHYIFVVSKEKLSTNKSFN